mgnify:CR=1 FL=1
MKYPLHTLGSKYYTRSISSYYALDLRGEFPRFKVAKNKASERFFM